MLSAKADTGFAFRQHDKQRLGADQTDRFQVMETQFRRIEWRVAAGSMPELKSTVLAAQPVHHPYASMNWIRFIGSLRCAGRRHQFLSPLSGLPR